MALFMRKHLKLAIFVVSSALWGCAEKKVEDVVTPEQPLTDLPAAPAAPVAPEAPIMRELDEPVSNTPRVNKSKGGGKSSKQIKSKKRPSR